MMRGLASGMIGSSAPAMIKVGWRISGRAGRLVQTEPASSWWRVADAGARHELAIEQLPHDAWVVTRAAAIDAGGDPGSVFVIQESAWGQHLQQGPRIAGNHEDSGTGGHQDHGAAAAWMLEGELLGQRAAPGEAEDVHLPGEADLAQQSAEHRSQIREPVRQGRIRRAAGAGNVDPYHGSFRIELRDKGIEDLQTGADAVAQHERYTGPPAHVDPDPLSEYGNEALFGPAAREFRAGALSVRAHKSPAPVRAAAIRHYRAWSAPRCPDRCARRAIRRSSATTNPAA